MPEPQAPAPRPILCFATQGHGGNEEARIVKLLGELAPEVWPYERGGRVRLLARLLGTLRARRPALVVMEGSGAPGGIALILGRLLFGLRYVVSSGDAIAPYLTMRLPLLRPAFALYERLLYRLSAGVIGWTPYLVGRAISYGAPRGVTAEGFSHHPRRDDARAAVRARLGIPAEAIVVGLLGALVWTASRRYCYGLELVEALRRVARDDLYVLIVGDGSGKAELARRAGPLLGTRVLLPGRCALAEVPVYLAAMDLASLPQSVDAVGALRYTTKIAEYASAGLPVVMSRIPMAYDFDADWIVRLPGRSPWDPAYVGALATLLDAITPAEIQRLRARVPAALPQFDERRQTARVTAFVRELLAERQSSH